MEWGIGIFLGILSISMALWIMVGTLIEILGALVNIEKKIK